MMTRKGRPSLAAAVVVLVGCLAGAARGDFASDQAECASSLVGLSTCLDYVEGSAKSPTPDCCSGLKQVIGKSAKCLCVLVKDRNEPQLGFKIDPNRAMGLPSTCHSPVNITQCIDLLKLPLNSKDAEIFKQYGDAMKSGASPGAPAKAAPSSSSSSPATAAPKTKDNSGAVARRWATTGLCAGALALSSLAIMGV